MDDLISRAEAIRVASGYCHWTNIPAELAKLPSVTPKPCEDAVSRELVKKDIARWIGYIDEDMIARMHITIDKLPPVTPAPKMGRWMSDNTMFDTAICSSCNYHTGYEYDFIKIQYNFCPNCGAKMWEEGE